MLIKDWMFLLAIWLLGVASGTVMWALINLEWILKVWKDLS